jgi:ribosomal protein S18 acetylase RimI-like enzyme
MTDVVRDSSVLDNVGWHSIIGRHAALADRVGNAGRYHRDVAPFSAIAGDEGWDDLATIIGVGKPAILFGPHIQPPEGWTTDMSMPVLQFVADGVSFEGDFDDVVRLGPQDVSEMIELVKATNPGPFSERTIEMGAYWGIRKDGRLVAMSGERMNAPGYTEISAVCTAEEVRGQGLGRKLVLATIKGIRDRGDEAFLHVVNDNTPAIKLYESLGFTVRCEAFVVFVRKNLPALHDGR